jgi:hypothetical protein
MSDMYIYLCDPVTPVEAVDLRILTDLLRKSKRFLWIPDRNLELDSTLQWGTMVSLSCVVRAWPNDKIYKDIPLCPIKALTDSYHDQDVQLLFSRVVGFGAAVCSACQIVENSFGPRGSPYDGGMRGGHKCLCEDLGFGRYDACLIRLLCYLYNALLVLFTEGF